MKTIWILPILMAVSMPCRAIVKYDEGNLIINGIQLFQDSQAPLDYYYLPRYPKLASRPDGSLEVLFLKYVGQQGMESNGGIFHALVEFALTPQEIADLETQLAKKVSGARIRGPVPMQEALKDGEKGIASFRIISSVLGNTSGDRPFTTNVITSGHAPFLPGSRAAISANLSQQGATLLWESFQSGTSDVSVAIEGFFEAAVKGYNAVVEADMDVLYEHFSELQNVQGGFSRNQTRKIIDSLVQTQTIKIDVLDRSAGLGINTEDLQKIMDIITNQLVSLMFDSKTGWAKVPDQEKPADGEIKGRYKLGGLPGFFVGSGSQAYIPDNQYILKQRKDIRSYKFYMNLSKSTTIKVPVFSAGNLRGLYDIDKEEGRYFRIVNLDDPDFQKREVFFQLDADYTEGFGDIINFVSVSFRKPYAGGGHADVTSDLIFNRKDVESGLGIKTILYPRLGITSADWLDYEYRVNWSLKGMDTTLCYPEGRENWQSSTQPAVSLTPPFSKRIIEIDADRAYFKDEGVRSATVSFFVILGGKARFQKMVTLRQEDPVNTAALALYFDEKQPIAYKVNWYTRNGECHEDLRLLDGAYLFLVPPGKDGCR